MSCDGRIDSFYICFWPSKRLDVILKKGTNLILQFVGEVSWSWLSCLDRFHWYRLWGLPSSENTFYELALPLCWRGRPTARVSRQQEDCLPLAGLLEGFEFVPIFGEFDTLMVSLRDSFHRVDLEGDEDCIIGSFRANDGKFDDPRYPSNEHK